jgi:N6-adenosine-specific RNA methylase IME4
MLQRRLYANNAVKQQAYRDRKTNPTVRLVPVSTAPGRYVTSLADLLAEGQRFGCIMADPPWPYDDAPPSVDMRKYYPPMPLEDICALPVRDLALPASHLHLWVTTAFLFAAKQVLDAWGFTPRSECTWGKMTKDGKRIQMGCGHYWRGSHEPCLLGVRGNLTARQHNLCSLILAPRGRHSQKTDIARDRIEQFSPGPYLELFGRAAVPGWTVWGNECLPTNGRLFKERVS